MKRLGTGERAARKTAARITRAAGEARSQDTQLSVATPLTRDLHPSVSNAPGGTRTHDLTPSQGSALSTELRARDRRGGRGRVYVREAS